MKRSNMIIEKVVTSDKLSLMVYKDIVKDPVATVFLIHGFGEYARRYDDFVFFLNLAGIEVVRFDQRGHGRSEGERAFVRQFDDYVSDLDLIINKFSNPHIPVFILGQSMGGLVATRYIIDRGENFIGGLVLLSPLAGIDKQNYSPTLIRISHFLGTYLPRLKTVKLKAEFLSRTPGVMEAYLNDGLIYSKGIKARLGLELLKSVKYVNHHFSKITLPILILHGTEDKISDINGSRKMYEMVKSEDKQIIEWEGCFHELLKEPEHQEVYEQIRDWLTEEVRLLNAPTYRDMAQ